MTPLKLHRKTALLNQVGFDASPFDRIEGAIQMNGLIPFSDINQIKPTRVILTKKNNFN